MRPLLLLIFLLAYFHSPAQITFQKTFGGSGDEKSYCIEPSIDGGYIIGGSTTSFGNGGKDAFAIKLDQCGNVEWSKTVGTSFDEYFFWIEQTNDKGYIASGTASGVVSGMNVTILTKLDSSGNLQWTKYFDAVSVYAPGGIVHQTNDHGYILMARNLPNNNYYLIKTDSIGNLEWSSTYFSGLNTKIGGGIQQTPDSGYIITGFTSIPSYGVCAIKLDKFGTFQWSKIYSNNSGINESSYYVELTDDGGFVYIGESGQIGGGIDNVYLIKTDGSGNLQWAKTYWIAGLSLRSFSGMQTVDRGYILSCYSYSSPNLESYIIKTDSLGNINWAKSYGGPGDDPCYLVHETSDGYVLAGWTNSYGSGQNDIYVIKTDPFGESGCIQGNPLFTSTACTPNVVSITPVITPKFNIGTVNYSSPSQNIIFSVICINQNPQLICSNDVYIINGHTYSTSGTYYDTLSTVTGCDSIVVTQLTVINSSTSSQSATACDNYLWNGNTYLQSGVYSDTLINSIGCDSIVILNLTVNHTDTSTQTIAACGSYIWNGNNYTLSGVYSDTLINSAGCDSILFLNLTINQSVSSTQTITACDSYLWNGNNYTLSGVYSDTVINSAGCDSILFLNLTINQSVSSTQNITACDSYLWNGNTYLQSGVYSDTLVNSAGCDSILTLNLTINQFVSSTQTFTACDGYLWNGNTYLQSGVYSDTLINSAGCDSILILNLTVNHSDSSSQTIAECDSYSWNGNNYTISGTYRDTISTINGCDSVLILQLTINHSVTSTQSINACNSYSWNGNNYSTSGTYQDTLIGITGCDSIVTINLTINGTYNISRPVSICDGDTYSFNGNDYTTAGVYHDTLSTTNGCDSIITTVITINPLPPIDAGSDTTMEESAIVHLTATGGSSYFWSTGQTSASIMVLPTVTTVYYVTGTGANNCLNTDSVKVIIDHKFYFYVPNAFSPNGDGINDLFFGQGSCIDKFNMKIFDRWGESIYETDNLQKPWDGTAKNENAQTGVYVYYFEIIDCHSEKHELAGRVSLLY